MVTKDSKKSKDKKERKQAEKFADAAKALGVADSDSAFEAALRTVANAPPTPRKK